MESKHELVIPNEDLPFKLFLFEGKDGKYVREKHWHRSIEIFAVFEGMLNFYLEDKLYPLYPGEFVIVNSNEVHSVFCPVPNKTVVLQIPLQTFKRYFTGEQFIRFSHSPKEQDAEVMQLLDGIYQMYTLKETGYDLKVQSSFYMLLYYLVAKYRKTEVAPELLRKNQGMRKLSAITDYMKENYEKELSLETLAGMFGYSSTYLSKMFQKYAQTNYKNYLDSIRLEHAYKELTETDHPVGEIAYNNGFPNSKAFAKVFRERYGMLPSKYKTTL